MRKKLLRTFFGILLGFSLTSAFAMFDGSPPPGFDQAAKANHIATSMALKREWAEQRQRFQPINGATTAPAPRGDPWGRSTLRIAVEDGKNLYDPIENELTYVLSIGFGPLNKYDHRRTLAVCAGDFADGVMTLPGHNRSLVEGTQPITLSTSVDYSTAFGQVWVPGRTGRSGWTWCKGCAPFHAMTLITQHTRFARGDNFNRIETHTYSTGNCKTEHCKESIWDYTTDEVLACIHQTHWQMITSRLTRETGSSHARRIMEPNESSNSIAHVRVKKGEQWEQSDCPQCTQVIMSLLDAKRAYERRRNAECKCTVQ